MDREINLDSIRALDKQIEEHEKAIIHLKRTRNSLLNVSTLLPPEILGNVFRWNVIPDGDFGGLSEDSYNFLLVCHHWFEVASRTPELWCFWGNTIQDWSKRHSRRGYASLDLIVSSVGRSAPELDEPLRDALQDRAARGVIRRVHVRGVDEKIIEPIISSIITPGEGVLSNGVESFMLRNAGYHAVDVSRFFIRYNLPKLRRLNLSGMCRISSWNSLKSHTAVLTNLSLKIEDSPIPTLSQLLSFLSSNPNLQHLVLSGSAVPHADDNASSLQVPLRHLNKLHITSDFCRAFRLLNRLELPDKMDSLRLLLYECSSSDLSQTLGPYFGDRVRRRGRFPGGGLELLANRDPGSIRLCVGEVYRNCDSTELDWFADVSAVTSTRLKDEEADELCFDLIAHIPRDQVISLRTTLPILRSEESCVEMCDLTYLHLVDVNLTRWSVEPDIRGPHTSKEILPSLDHITITRPTVSGGNWDPFVDFLSRRAAFGNRISSLKLSGYLDMDENVVEGIKRVVKAFQGEGNDEDGS